MALTRSKKRELVSIFLEAAIAYELTGDWRGVFKTYTYSTNGTLYRSVARWSEESLKHFITVINLLMKNYESVTAGEN